MLMVGNGVSTAFGGLLALSIAGIRSSNGYKPWRWIFIIEGCMTFGVTVIVYFFMSDWPATCKWLSADEKAIIAEKSKLRYTKIKGSKLKIIVRGHSVGKMDRLDAKAIRRIVCDWKTYIW